MHNPLFFFFLLIIQLLQQVGRGNATELRRTWINAQSFMSDIKLDTSQSLLQKLISNNTNHQPRMVIKIEAFSP